MATTPSKLQSNSIITILSQQRNGEMMQEASEALDRAREACELTGKPATVTLKLKLASSKAGAIIFSDDVIEKLPVAEKATSIFYPSPDGGFQRQDPRQKEMDLRVVAGSKPEAQELKQVVNA